MRRADYWICFWPGFRGVWLDGRPLALAWAAAFAALLNLALVSSLVWPELLSPRALWANWSLVIAGWLGSVWFQYRQACRDADPPTIAGAEDGLFIQAQAEYLKGNWEEAEWLLRQRLSTATRDVEARLLLLTLYRRRGRRELAFEQLTILHRFDGAAAWTDELEREARFLETVEPPESADAAPAEPSTLADDSPADPEPRKIDTNSVRRAA